MCFLSTGMGLNRKAEVFRGLHCIIAAAVAAIAASSSSAITMGWHERRPATVDDAG